MSPKRMEVEQILVSLSDTSHCLIVKDCKVSVAVVESVEGTQEVIQHKCLYNMATREKHEVPARITGKELA